MTRAGARYCVNGHDTWEVGRYKSGTCRMCNRLFKQVIYNREHGGVAACRLRRHIRKMRVPDSVLVELYSLRFDVSRDGARKALYRLMRSARIEEGMADNWCVAIGAEFSVMYPELYMVPAYGTEEAS